MANPIVKFWRRYNPIRLPQQGCSFVAGILLGFLIEKWYPIFWQFVESVPRLGLETILLLVIIALLIATSRFLSVVDENARLKKRRRSS